MKAPMQAPMQATRELTAHRAAKRADRVIAPGDGAAEPGDDEPEMNPAPKGR